MAIKLSQRRDSQRTKALSSAENTQAENTQAENTLAENTPAENTPAEEQEPLPRSSTRESEPSPRTPIFPQRPNSPRVLTDCYPLPFVTPFPPVLETSFHIGDSEGGTNATRFEGLSITVPFLTGGNVNAELPRLITPDNIRRFGEAQIKMAIACKMESALHVQWDGVLNMGLSLVRSMGALLGTTEATELGDFEACLKLRQRPLEPPVLFALRAEEHVRKIMKTGFIRNDMTAYAIMNGLLPGFHSRLPTDPPKSLPELKIILQTILEKFPDAGKGPTMAAAPPIPRLMDRPYTQHGGPRRDRPDDRHCYNCNQPGHLQRFCPRMTGTRQRKSPVLPISVYSVGLKPDDPIIIKLRIGNKEVDGLIDPGSSLSLCSTTVAALTQDRHSRRISLRGFIGPSYKSSEVATISFAHEGGRYTWDFVVTPGLNADLILGLDYLESEASTLNFKTRKVTFDKARKEPRNLTNSEPIEIPGAPEEVQAIVNEYRDTFARSTAELGRAHGFRCDIPTTGDPFRHTYRSIPYTLQEEFKRQVDEMLLARVIQPSASPYASQVLFQRKGDGTWRLCVDFRKLNSQTVKVATPIPKPRDIMARLGGSAVFTTLDLASGYWQIGVNPKDRYKTAFVTPWGL